jgi:PAS domain S-box-containing protein
MRDPLLQLDALGDSSDGLYVVDDQQRIIRWNRGAERLLGYPAGEVLNRICHDVIAGCGRTGHPICGPACHVQRCVERGDLPRGVELHTHARDGRGIWVRLSVIVVPHASGPVTVHVLQDVSEHRHEADVIAQISSLCRPNTLHGDGAGEPWDGGPREARVTFTTREREVFRLMADGLPNPVIAERLEVSVYTVRNHVRHILEKSAAHSRTEAVALALRNRLF